MNQKSLIQGVRVGHNAQDHHHVEINKRNHQYQQHHHDDHHHKQQHQQQHRQHHHHQQQQHQQHHNYQHAQHLSTTYGCSSNPTHRQFWVEQDQSHSLPTITQNFENNNIPYTITNNGRRLVAQAPSYCPSYQNQDALQQLENNLKLVLQQQQRQQPPHKQQLNQSHRTSLMPGSEHSHKDVTVNVDRSTRIQHREDKCDKNASPITFNQSNTISLHQISSADSTTPNLTEEGPITNNIDDNINNNNVSRQQDQHRAPIPYSYESQLPSHSINLASSGLYALGDEVQPISTKSQHKVIRPRISSPLSPTANLGNWSDEVTTEEVANDIFMNNLFHAELKMSRKKKSADFDSKKRRRLHSCSKADESAAREHSQPLSSTTKCIVSPTQTKKKNPSREISETQPRCHSPNPVDEDTKASTFLKTKIKTSRKKKSKHGLTKQKKKTSLKRQPKFPVLEKDPPIEEQILALPAIALAPSLLASIVANDQRYNSKVSDIRVAENSIPHPKMTVRTLRRKQSGTYFGSKHDDVENDNEEKNDTLISPIQIFHKILKARGHNEMYSVDSEGTEYDVVPSPLQLASYGTYLVWAVGSSDSSLVRKLLSCGLSPNPCNQFRDSILGDLVCKKGKVHIYKCFVEDFDADVRVVDGFGRTLLHHCCWANELCRPIVEDILQRDPIQIFLRDKQEKTPLEYVSANAYGAWKRFLKEVADKYWPTGRMLPQFTPPLGGRRQLNGDLMDPPEALTPALAAGVASGNLTPEAVSALSDLSHKKKPERINNACTTDAGKLSDIFLVSKCSSVVERK